MVFVPDRGFSGSVRETGAAQYFYALGAVPAGRVIRRVRLVVDVEGAQTVFVGLVLGPGRVPSGDSWDAGYSLVNVGTFALRSQRAFGMVLGAAGVREFEWYPGVTTLGGPEWLLLGLETGAAAGVTLSGSVEVVRVLLAEAVAGAGVG